MDPFLSAYRALPMINMREINSNAAFYKTIGQLHTLSTHLTNPASNLQCSSKKLLTLHDSLKDAVQLLNQLKAIHLMLEQSILECKNILESPLDTHDNYPLTWLIHWKNYTLTSLFFETSATHTKEDASVTIPQTAKDYYSRYEIIQSQLVALIRHFDAVYTLLESSLPLKLDTIGLSAITDPTNQPGDLSPRLV